MKILLFVSLVIGGCAAAIPRHVIMAPKVFYVGVPQKIHVALNDVKSQCNVEVGIQVFLPTEPHWKTISSDRGVFSRDKPSGLLSLTVGLDNVTSSYLTRKNNWQFHLLARISESQQQSVSKENRVKIAVSYNDGLVLIQTDKPIYTPNQKVKIRVVPLGFDLMPSTKKIQLIVKNPQGIRVQQWSIPTTDMDSGFSNRVVAIGSNAMVGNWTIEVYYGHLFVHNTSKTFEVREYILPKFSVKIKGPYYITSDSSPVKVSVQAKYTYGKPVQGTVSLRLYVVGILKEPLHLYSFRTRLNEKGVFQFDLKMEDIKNLLQDKWFPAIEGHRLQITADVTEKSTGKTETAVDDSIYFVVSPYRIHYVDTQRYFKPGIPFKLKVKVTYPNQENAASIQLVSKTKNLDENGNDLVSQSFVKQDVEKTTTTTDENGVALFVINIPSNARKLIINVNTTDFTIGKKQNAYKTLVVEASSQADEVIKLRQNNPSKVWGNAECEAVIKSSASVHVEQLFYFVISRGQIVYNQKIDRALSILTTISFKVTPSMSPSARLVAYYFSNDKIVSDSILLDIEDTFPNQILLVPPNQNKEYLPAQQYKMEIVGTVGTNVSLLVVDQSVYLLSKMNLLTPERVFKKMEKMDLGCGAGGGFDTKDVFKNAGMVVMSRDFDLSARGEEKCEAEHRRTKRSITKTQDHMDFCCNLGNKTDPNERNCYRRAMEVDVGFLDQNLIHECKAKYLNCCITAFGFEDIGILARSGIPEQYVEPSDDPEMLDLNLRQFFPETWLNEDLTIRDNTRSKACSKLHRDVQSKCGSIEFSVTLPDTMTTWVVQAMGVSNTTGFGIAKPLHITTFQPFFVHLSMPYSVQRGEEISILATIFNYKEHEELVHLYLKGDESFCSLARPGKTHQLTSSKITVKAQSSVSYTINVLPLKFGEIPIEVNVRGRFAGDKVLKKLLVVPEGVEEIMTQSYVLDPKEFFKGRKEQGEKQQNDAEHLSFQSTQTHNTSKGEQVNKILLKINKKAIPESVDAKVYLTGNIIGQAVTNIAVGQLKHLLYLPYGCGEQNMNAVGPNVYALHYLQATNQMTKEMESKKIDYIQEGYLRELNYRQDSGSFAYFASSRKQPGSTWLTAFVVKVFCQARKIKGIEIDKTLLCVSVSWLLGKQGEDGTFIEDLRVRYIKGLGSSGKVGAYTSSVTLTAFVLIALKQCQCGGYLDEDERVTKATTLLEGSFSNLTDAYALALTTYALVLANSPEKLRANRRLAEMATFNSATSTRYWETGSKTRNIKAAAYALLAQVALNRLKYAGPIVVWLTKQRGPKGGFASTTDTTIALESLARYSELANMNKLDMKVWIKKEKNPMKLNKDTALLQQEVDIEPYLDKELTVKTIGTGVGQLQVNVKYNVPSKKKDRCDFHLRIKITEDESGKLVSESPVHPRTRRAIRSSRKRKGSKSNRGSRRRRNQRRNRKRRIKRIRIKPTTKPLPQSHEIPKKLIVTICARYKKRGTTGMAIIDAGILTGYSVVEESLAKLVKKENSSIERYELSDRAVVFYLDRIDSVKPLCVAFGVFRDFHVGGIQPVPVKVYDYYEPDDSCTLFYNLGQRSKSVGECKDSGICTCTQEICPRANPSIEKIGRLRKRICKRYDYAIKGKVVLIDEDHTWLTYDVEVITVLKQPWKDKLINATNVLEFRKNGMCITPHLKKKETVLIMGQIDDGQFILNKDAFVKKLDKNDEKVVDKLVAHITKRRCGGS